jgi:uncharacterized membrane protein YedE/YeeE
MLRFLSAFAAGVLFAVGLSVSGMVQPDKVQGFLDFAGDWQPALMFVMGGAVVVYTIAFRLIHGKRQTPLAEARFYVPTRRDITPRLIGGAVMFGAGWGLAGFCPGPAIASLGTGAGTVMLFVGAMIAGMYLFEVVDPLLKKLNAPASDGASLRGQQVR